MKTSTAEFLESTLRGIKRKFNHKISLHERQLMRRLSTLSQIAKIRVLAPSQREELEAKLEELAKYLSSIDEDASGCIKTALTYIKED